MQLPYPDDELPLEFERQHRSTRRDTGAQLQVPEDLLVSSASSVSSQYATSDAWSGSPFAWLRLLATASRAKAAESMVEHALLQLGFRVSQRTSSGHDRLVEGRKVRIKFSTLWRSGLYTFQQVKDEDYEYVLLLGVSPGHGHLWVLEKATALRLAGSPTAWISFAPEAPPVEIGSAGGLPSAAAGALLSAFGPPSNFG